ncbi:hypothetical protein FHS21_006167 [Phyllobacterium trifolii]|uniref:Uncharacterized protein n=1 Tax=Phyllobacterium trifolii TaxID=300193 RepID=A0A839UIY3_9HYPH|nr:hypothetical protein [Phyllobacterium trifolii]MBB3149713.1 hypothetical protein [Phyllobacterium trifolii]
MMTASVLVSHSQIVFGTLAEDIVPSSGETLQPSPVMEAGIALLAAVWSR